MSTQQPVLLVVDDNKINQDLISKSLRGCDYVLDLANNGEEAWAKLKAAPDRYDAVLLDRMMPGIDGMEVLRRIKQDEKLKLLPVILQTAATFPEQIAEGLSAGAFYYLTKPYDFGVMRAVVATALRDRAARINEENDAYCMQMALQQLNEAFFTFNTVGEARKIATLMSSACPSREAVHMGLMELMLNAVEHGNLGISYEEKSQLIADNNLQAEVERRCTLPEYAGKLASISFKRLSGQLLFTIKDEGKGFDWEPYLEMDMNRMMDNHGRGIAMSRLASFSTLEYRGIGNCVEVSIALADTHSRLAA